MFFWELMLMFCSELLAVVLFRTHAGVLLRTYADFLLRTRAGVLLRTACWCSVENSSWWRHRYIYYSPADMFYWEHILGWCRTIVDLIYYSPADMFCCTIDEKDSSISCKTSERLANRLITTPPADWRPDAEHFPMTNTPMESATGWWLRINFFQ